MPVCSCLARRALAILFLASVAGCFPAITHGPKVENGFIVGDNKMVDEGGHQLAHIQYPGLPADEILSAVHRFYDEYYFRPKAVFRILKKAAFDSHERKRLYGEAKTFLKLRSQRNKLVKKHAKEAAAGQPPAGPTTATRPADAVGMTD